MDENPCGEVVVTSHQLAAELARRAAQIRDQVQSIFESEAQNGPLHTLFERLKAHLIHDLDIAGFADMYAQTLTYGLFSARAAHGRDFVEEDIFAVVLNTSPFLKAIFDACTTNGTASTGTTNLEAVGIPELIKLLRDSDIEAVLQDFRRKKKGEDPVIHFYEVFLREYSPEQKVKRGVFSTPDAIVSFIVRSVDYLLRKEFGLADGLADTSPVPFVDDPVKEGNTPVKDAQKVFNVQILDPATGTGTFLSHVIEKIKETYDKKHEGLQEEELREKWNRYVSNQLLPRVFGFELMMAPYAVAHVHIGLKLAETGYDLQPGKRARIYLTNTLEPICESSRTRGFCTDWLTKEGDEAQAIKTAFPITVVIGNPPYSGHSENNSLWIADLLRGKIQDGARQSSYFEVDNGNLGEPNPKWLNDDYVKFIRFGQWLIDKTGYGILAFITNHSYLDNPTFRGMRQQLMESFTHIYLLDLHGNTKKPETCPDGQKDENVFDIQQGVAIGIFVNLNSPTAGDRSHVYHADVWGLREDKYKALGENDISTITWEELSPDSPFYLFKPVDTELKEEYENGWKITDIMPVHSVGVITARDRLTIQSTREALWEVVNDFCCLPEEEARTTYGLGKDTRDWKVRRAQKDIRDSTLDRTRIRPILYRPFDVRYTYYTGKSRGFLCMPRHEVMKHFMMENVGLLTCRQQNTAGFYHGFVCEHIAESCVVSNKTREINHVFPLYLYPAIEKTCSSFRKNPEEKIPNIRSDLIKRLTECYGHSPSPYAIFSYIYALFYSQEYRSRYKEFLKTDFPRVFFTSNYQLFLQVSSLGKHLISLHLMHQDALQNSVTVFEGEGDNTVESIGKKSYKEGRVYINTTQYFSGVPEDVYTFSIGGYKVCETWLKYRTGQSLTEEDIIHYQRIVAVIGETIGIMKEIDAAIDTYGGWPVE